MLRAAKISVQKHIFRQIASRRLLPPVTVGTERLFNTSSALLSSVEDNLKAARAQTREMQGRVKSSYKESPDLAKSVARSKCVVPGFVDPMNDQSPHCFVERQSMHREKGEEDIMGLAPSTGGDDTYGCSADMVMQALLGCTGTTLRAVASARGAIFDRCVVEAEGDYDARGTLGVDRETPVGLTAVRLNFRFEVERSVRAGHVLGSADWEKVLASTEKYCVVAQTLVGGLKDGIQVSYTIDHGGAGE